MFILRLKAMSQAIAVINFRRETRATRLMQQFLRQTVAIVFSFFFQNAVESRSNENVCVYSGFN